MMRLRNPHSILLALKKRPEAVKKISLGESENLSEAWAQVKALGLKHKIPFGAMPSTPDLPKPKMDKKKSGDQAPGRSSFLEALVEPKSPVTVEELFEGAEKRKNGKGIWLALDTVVDPQNVGAIFRAASFFGVEGVLLTAERSAPFTPVVYDVSCGGVEALPFSQIVNLQRAFEKAKEQGIWILGTSEHAKRSYREIKLDRPWLIVVGNEEKGLRKLTLERCDEVCKIPQGGEVDSLNVGTATAVMLSRFVG